MAEFTGDIRLVLVAAKNLKQTKKKVNYSLLSNFTTKACGTELVVNRAAGSD